MLPPPTLEPSTERSSQATSSTFLTYNGGVHQEPFNLQFHQRSWRLHHNACNPNFSKGTKYKIQCPCQSAMELKRIEYTYSEHWGTELREMGIEYRLLFLELNTSFTESNTSQKNLSYCSLSSSSSNTHLHLQSLCSLSMNLIYHTQDLFLILLNSNKHSCNVKTIRVCQNNKGKWLAQCVFSITNALGIDSLLVIG